MIFELVSKIYLQFDLVNHQEKSGNLEEQKKNLKNIECMNERLVASFPVPIITNQNLRWKSTQPLHLMPPTRRTNQLIILHPQPPNISVPRNPQTDQFSNESARNRVK